MIAHFEISFDDIMALHKDAINTTNIHKKKKYATGLLGAVILFSVLLVLEETIVFKDIVISLIYAFIFLFLGPLIYINVTLYKIKITLKKDNNFLHMAGNCKLTITDQGFYKEMENTTENIDWKRIKRVSEDNDRYYFYLSDIHAFIIKKSPNNMDESETLNYNQLIKKSINDLGLGK